MVLDVLYYYYYLIYTKIIPDNEPHSTAIFTLSISEMMILNFIAEVYLVKIHCISLPIWISVSLLILILLCNFFYYGVAKRGVAIVKKQPEFLQSNTLSVIITALFFIIAAVCMVYGSIYTHELLDECRLGANH